MTASQVVGGGGPVKKGMMAHCQQAQTSPPVPSRDMPSPDSSHATHLTQSLEQEGDRPTTLLLVPPATLAN